MKNFINRIRTTDKRRLAVLTTAAVAAVALNWGVAKLFGWAIATNPNDYSVSDAGATGYLIGFAFSFAVIDLVRWAGKVLSARFIRKTADTVTD